MSGRVRERQWTYESERERVRVRVSERESDIERAKGREWVSETKRETG